MNRTYAKSTKMVRCRKTLQFLLTIALLGFLSQGNAWAQMISGSMNGYVTDPSGAAVPAASVVIANTGTGVQTKTVTSPVGLYSVSELAPGEYSLTVEAAGFKRFVQEKITVGIDVTVRVDAKLALGATTQEITVTSAPDMLQAVKTDTSKTVNERAVESLPTIGRNLTFLYALVPGATNPDQTVGFGQNPANFQGYDVNGQYYGTNIYLLDGIIDADYGSNSHFQMISPNQESVQEMKITTSDYDPEFGTAAGMVAQFVTKSGTNDLHGSVYEFNRNKWSSAADPFTQKIPGTGPHGAGTGPAPFNNNQGGFSLGGPIKKNKMFFFGDYDFTRQVFGDSQLVTVPTPAFARGDFSAFATQFPIYDPSTGNPDGSGRTQFSYNGALNVIPPNRLSPAAVAGIALLPPPNVGSGTDLNYANTVTGTQSRNQWDVKYDWNISDKDKFFARYTYAGSGYVNPGVFGNTAGGWAGSTPVGAVGYYRVQGVALNYTHSFGPSLLAETRLGLMRYYGADTRLDASQNEDSTIGIPNINNLPYIQTGGLAGFSTNGPVGALYYGWVSWDSLPILERTTNIEPVSNWTWLKGAHQVRWGVDVARLRSEFFDAPGDPGGNFSFDNTVTGDLNVSNSGIGMASYLLGMPSEYDNTIMAVYPGRRRTHWGFYGSDTFKVTRNLTINYGLRYDVFGPFTTRNRGQLTNFDITTGNLIYAGLGGNSNSANIKTDYGDFGPRLGFAYKLVEKTVLRAGIGRSYFQSNYGASQSNLIRQYPNAGFQSINQPSLYTDTGFTLDQGPTLPPAPVYPASGVLVAPKNGSISEVDPHWKQEHADSWNFTVEHQFSTNLKMSLAYVGSASTNYYNYVANDAPPGPGDLLSRRPLYQLYGYTASSVYYFSPSTNANYNSLQFILEKRFSNGYMVDSTFTWQKALNHLDSESSQNDQGGNPYDRKGSYGIATYNRAAVWTLSHNYQLPFGPGLRFGSSATGIKKVLLAGWQFNGITTVESGFALSPTLSSGATLNADFGQRPDRIPGVSLIPPGGKTRQHWFNVAAFAPPPACCVWGNAARGSMTGPSFISADWSFWKEFTFKTPLSREETTLQFRWENFNFFNNTNMALPNNTIDSSTAGVISSLVANTAGVTQMRNMQFGLRLVW